MSGAQMYADDEPNETGIHELKTWPDPFDAVRAGTKPFEWRKADRNFVEGDIVILREWDPDTKQYSGRELTGYVGHVLHAPAFGVPDGHCIFGLLDIEERVRPRREPPPITNNKEGKTP